METARRGPMVGQAMNATTIVTQCVDLDANVAFFVDDAGFRVHLITPADDPCRVVLDGHGIRLALIRSDRDVAAHFEAVCGEDDDARLARPMRRAPNGSTVSFLPPMQSVVVPDSQPSLSIVRSTEGTFGVGRAGMNYRDLLPDRWGGRFIASHIEITEGGDVADWVHFHRIRFQMIFVASGWVDVVYEDQGPPFTMVAGDCVLQPPEIRHRVLRSSPGLEVIEIGCPAEHDTIAEHAVDLPTSSLRPDRDFGGQRFVRHVASESVTAPWVVAGLRARDTGIGDATSGLAGAVVVSAADIAAADQAVSGWMRHDDEFVICVGLAGRAVVEVRGGDRIEFTPRTSVALPPGTEWRWVEIDPEHQALVVSMSAGAIVAVDAPA